MYIVCSGELLELFSMQFQLFAIFFSSFHLHLTLPWFDGKIDVSTFCKTLSWLYGVFELGQLVTLILSPTLNLDVSVVSVFVSAGFPTVL